jgi:hypothetical protein
MQIRTVMLSALCTGGDQLSQLLEERYYFGSFDSIGSPGRLLGELFCRFGKSEALVEPTKAKLSLVRKARVVSLRAALNETASEKLPK